jgi:glycosyltransferase involved in cell wall biosynthesis
MASESERGLVSVVTIFLDAERFLGEAIESVLAQTYQRWELLLVDDGSRDESPAIARRYAAEHPDRIRVLAHPGRENRGMSASRNLGIAHGRGEFVALLDADDVYLAEKLEHQVGLLVTHLDAGAVYGTTQYWYGWTGRAEDVARDRPRRVGVARDTLVRPPSLLGRFLSDEVRTPCTCGVVMRRVAIERAGGFEEAFRGIFEDQVFFYKLFATSAVWVDGRCLDRYRQHPDSWCHRLREQGEWDGSERPTASRRQFLEWLAAYAAEHDLTDAVLHAELRRQLRPYLHPVRHRVATIAERLRLTRRRPRTAE